MNLIDVFTKADAFLTSVEAKTSDLLDKGSATLRHIADWIDLQKAGLKFAGPGDAATCEALLARCEALATPAPHAPKEAGGVLAGLLVQLLTTFLSQLLKQQP